MNRSHLSVVIFTFFLVNVSSGKILNDSLSPGKNFDKAAFRLWMTDDNRAVGGVLVLMPGSAEDGRSLAEDPFWQGFAKQHNFALVGCFFSDRPHENMDVEEYANAKEGSGQALLDVLSLFAKNSGHAELVNAPLLLWGHSAGGEFNYEFACWQPQRVIAFVVNKGGIYYSNLASVTTGKVPGLFVVGEKDIAFRNDVIKGIFSINRRFGAIWTFAVEPGIGHAIGRTKELAAAFFNELLPLRLDTIQDANLLEIKEDSGWVGDPKTYEIIPFPNWQAQSYGCSWIVNAKFASTWLAFCKGKPF